jgi:hypothetical protein
MSDEDFTNVMYRWCYVWLDASRVHSEKKDWYFAKFLM